MVLQQMFFVVIVSLTLLCVAKTQQITHNDAQVEILKQRLVKFPEETFDPERRDDDTNLAKVNNNNNDKSDEAKRILEEIAKINIALGYVKKQPNNENKTKVPPILDSSQYLYPNPSYSPFNSQSTTKNKHGGTLLLPSIRAINLKGHPQNSAFNLPVKTSTETKYFFRPSEVQVSATDRKPLATHFVIPVHKLKMNKEEYLRKYAPAEYRIKGYKIVGDIDNFKNSTSPKYNLYLIPRELALRNASSFVTEDDASREEKVVLRPFKQGGALSGEVNYNKTTGQVIKKRIMQKPLRQKGSNVQQTQTLQGSTATTTTTVHITPPPLSVNPTSSGFKDKPTNKQGTQNTFNLFSHNNNSNNSVANKVGNISTNQNQTSATAIKMAFQNIFKLPFRPLDNQNKQKPTSAVEQNVQNSNGLEAVPLQVPQKVFYGENQSNKPQVFFGTGTIGNSPHKVVDSDYRWEDESISASVSANGENSHIHSSSEQDDNSEYADNNASSEKFWGQRQEGPLVNAQKEIQKEALKQGGIIIQKLKVKKGGIAIAGPGGVATAGSGGTAIVGPGGYALTHPRSLTIAGPGAKVIAIPEEIDLKDALLRTNIKDMTFPREGKIVATGPTVYYAPDV